MFSLGEVSEDNVEDGNQSADSASGSSVSDSIPIPGSLGREPLPLDMVSSAERTTIQTIQTIAASAAELSMSPRTFLSSAVSGIVMPKTDTRYSMLYRLHCLEKGLSDFEFSLDQDQAVQLFSPNIVEGDYRNGPCLCIQLSVHVKSCGCTFFHSFGEIFMKLSRINHYHLQSIMIMQHHFVQLISPEILWPQLLQF